MLNEHPLVFLRVTCSDVVLGLEMDGEIMCRALDVPACSGALLQCLQTMSPVHPSPSLFPALTLNETEPDPFNLGRVPYASTMLLR